MKIYIKLFCISSTHVFIFLYILSLRLLPIYAGNNIQPLNNLSQLEITLPIYPGQPLMPDGRNYPLVPNDPKLISSLIVKLEGYFQEKVSYLLDFPQLAHQQQVIYRVLSRNPILANNVLSLLPDKFRNIASRHINARKQFLKLSTKYPPPRLLPAWRIVKPEAAEKLLTYYKKAEASTGIQWQILAAINLVETGMGRISGVSSANAQGPMQFLPSTWSLNGIGMDGNINDPHDSIQAAARYLVSRGGLEDIRKGLWGYNNSDYYGTAVLEYARLMIDNPLSYYAFYHWEIHYKVPSGDLWLPVGYDQAKKIPISTYLHNFPASAPPDYPSFVR